jgi:hypothetical protein
VNGFKCEECDAVLADKYSKEANYWDWLTGYLPRTHYFCPLHVNSTKHAELFKLREQRPLDFGKPKPYIEKFC